MNRRSKITYAVIDGKKTTAPYIRGEQWKPIKDYPRYYISNKGRVYSFKHNKLLALNEQKNKYFYVHLWDNGKRKSFRLHRLIASNFLENPHNKPIVHHIDGNRYNNDVSNLMWVTHAEHKKLHEELDRLKGGEA